jgi:predicted ATPase
MRLSGHGALLGMGLHVGKIAEPDPVGKTQTQDREAGQPEGARAQGICHWQRAGGVPCGPGPWNGTDPGVPLGGRWKPWILALACRSRPGPPAAPGLFEVASGGTLFLDEIDALPLVLQGKLLKAIEERRIRHVGGVADKPVDIKLTVAAHADLSRRVAEGQFRADLYYRLAVVLLEVPPLRERGEDVLVLGQAFLRQYAAGHRVIPKRLSPSAVAWLQRYTWPGNVRELSHLMERVTLLHPDTVVDADALERLCLPRSQPVNSSALEPGRDGQPPEDEATRIRQVLRWTEGNVVQAARLLGLSRKALRYRMQRYGIQRPSRMTAMPPPTIEPGGPLPRPPFSGKGQRGRAAASEGATTHPPPQETFQEQAPSWEQKLVAVLAIEITWPVATVPASPQYEPWTLATRWEQIIAEKVQGFGGVVIQRTPSLQLVAFGLPQTLEQLPQRAVQAALALRRSSMEAQALPGREPSPTMRQAVHWGQLLVDIQARAPATRLLAIGETLALPVRLLGQAAPEEILLSPQMMGAVERWYELQVCEGPVEAGSSVRIGAYRVIGLNPQTPSLAQHDARALSRFVGRDREMATLHALLAQAEAGQGHVVGIVGEPGIGKSRLLDEFRRSLPRERLTYWRGRCLSYGSATPYLPVLDILRQHCGIVDADSPEAITAKVHRSLQEVGMAPDEWGPYILHLLGVGVRADRLAMLTPQALRARTIEALGQISVKSSQQRPLVLEVEDLHWMDATSEDWLAALAERVPGAPILVLATYRPGYRPPWLDKSYATQLALQRLMPRDSLQVVQAVLHDERVAEALAQEILARAGGNPFFLEELARIVVEQGDHRLALIVPDTIHAVLAARIDRLPLAEKRLLQAAAVIGTEVPFVILQAIVEIPEETLRSSLARLQTAEFLYEKGLTPDLAYIFKHALTHEVVYASLAAERRRVLHERTAQAIEALFHERLAERYSELAHHHSRSGNTARALDYLQRAGQQAVERLAHVEALSHLTTALALVKELPDASERLRRELTLQLALGGSFSTVKGYAAPEVHRAYTRADELARQLGDSPQIFAALLGLRRFAMHRGELPTAHALGEQLLHLAARLNVPEFLSRAHLMRAETCLFLGEFTHARTHAELGIACYDPRQHRAQVLRYGTDSGVCCRSFAAKALWVLGYPDQALQRSDEALALAQELAHPYSLAFALRHAAYIFLLRREPHRVLALADTAIALGAEHGFAIWLALGPMVRGWALVEQGQQAEGLAQIRQGVTAWRATGAVFASRMGFVVGAYATAGQTEEGLHALSEVQTAAQARGERFFEAELARLTGEFLLAQSSEHRVAAEAWFQQALAMARHQQAKSWELRAALGLSRLWQRQGKRAEAHQLLAGVYRWFTEGFDTIDLQEAKALLAELS